MGKDACACETFRKVTEELAVLDLAERLKMKMPEPEVHAVDTPPLVERDEPARTVGQVWQEPEHPVPDLVGQVGLGPIRVTYGEPVDRFLAAPRQTISIYGVALGAAAP